MNELQAAYVEVANSKFNGNFTHFDQLPTDLKATIARKFNFSHLTGSTRKPMSEEEKYQRRLAEKDAARAVAQRLEMERPTRPKTAREQRVELIEAKLASHDRANPGQRRRLESELRDAKTELQAERQQAQIEAEKLAFETKLSEHEMYQNALQSADAIISYAENSGDTEELQDALVAQAMLKQVENMDQVQGRIDDYWAWESRMREAEASKLMVTQIEADRLAADAVGKAAEAEKAVLDAQRSAETARHNASGANDE